MNPSLNPRAAELLKLLVERYIRDGEPVGSRTLSRAAGLGLSSATIRNVMSDLDELGLVVSPHTSAGRVPTARAYRYFVDSLLTPESLADSERETLLRELMPMAGTDELLQTASGLLSSLSRLAAVVTIPKRNRAILRRIEFLPLSDRRVLAILVVNQSEVQNRVLHVERDYSASELEQCANALNEHFAGRDLVGLRQLLAEELRTMRDQMNHTLLQAVTLAEQALRGQSPAADFVMSGGSNLMGFQELGDVQRLKNLFEAFDHKRDLLDLFDQCLNADGVQIFIGGESGYTVLDECSVVTAPYTVNGQVAGVLGVIGPTRMAYQRLIPLVSEAAKVLSQGLKAGN
ncbi:MAG: heat-inducible transcriptional repressor HrcA [Pseudomonadota bacterium]